MPRAMKRSNDQCASRASNKKVGKYEEIMTKSHWRQFGETPAISLKINNTYPR